MLFGAAVAAGALAHEHAALATLVTAASMVATPILFAGSEALRDPRLARRRRPCTTRSTPTPTPVIICGFGRFGQIVGRVLRMNGIAFTALERNAGPGRGGATLRHQGLLRRSRRAPDVLRAAGAETAKLLIVTMDDPPGVLRTVEMAKRNFPNLTILARARNRWYAHLLMDRDVRPGARDFLFQSRNLPGWRSPTSASTRRRPNGR